MPCNELWLPILQMWINNLCVKILFMMINCIPMIYFLFQERKTEKKKVKENNTFRPIWCSFARTYLFCFGGLTCSGTPSGDIVIGYSTNMQILTMIKKAHLGIVTALAFSPDSRFESQYIYTVLAWDYKLAVFCTLNV